MKFVQKSIDYLLSNGWFSFLNDRAFVSLLYYSKVSSCLNLKNPRKLNEKLQWLKLYNRKPEYSIYSDKVKVKDYIARVIGSDYVIPTLGVWKSSADIDFSKLPNKFVIKTNHNSGLGMYICTDKSKMNESAVRANLTKGLKQDYYKCWREWPYKNVERRILAEQFLENSDGSPIADYKFYCYGGKPRYFMYSVGEASHQVRNHKFDMDCNSIDYLFKSKETISASEIKLPENFNIMKQIVEKLAVGFEHIRIDLYNVDGKIYFGEMTFFSGAGFITIENEEYSQYLADLINLDNIKKL